MPANSKSVRKIMALQLMDYDNIMGYIPQNRKAKHSFIVKKPTQEQIKTQYCWYSIEYPNIYI